MQPRERTVLLVGICVSAAIWGLGHGVPLYAKSRSEARANAEEALRRAETARSSAQSRSLVGDSLAARRLRGGLLMPRVFVGRSQVALASAVSTHVSRLAGESNLRVSSFQVSVDDQRARLSRIVRIHVTATGDVRGVVRFLAAVESAKKLMRIVSLAVTQPDVAGREGAPETLGLLVTLEGLGIVQGVK